MSTTELIEINGAEAKPTDLMRRATDVAGVCKEIVLRTAMTIQGHKYVKVEGWQSIATAHGCVASSRDVERLQSGYRAIGEVRRVDTGVVVATAEGFVGDDEKSWADKPEYARRAMAQTRAISRACRSAFAHVVVLMDAGLSTTPAEEVPHEGFKPQPGTTKRQTEQAGDVITKECLLMDVMQKSGTSAKGPWTAWFCKFDDGEAGFEAGTFDAKLAANLEVLRGQEVRVSYKPGKRAGTFELVTIGPGNDNIP